MIKPVILCGGSGTRLWPLSRKLYPKQLLSLTGEKTLLQQTALRFNGREQFASSIIICNEEHRFLVAEQLHSVGVVPQAIILEPAGRNTAPAVALAAHTQVADGDESLMLVLPADHLIADVDHFITAVGSGEPLANDDHLVTFGVVPDKAETGYGYIQKGDVLGDPGLGVCRIKLFAEKPDLDTAESFVSSGDFLWNSGMFLFSAQAYLAELVEHEPEMAAATKLAVVGARGDLDFIRVAEGDFLASPANSIDYAVMEKTKKGVVVAVDPGWNDIGSWAALWEIADKDDAGNVLKGDILVSDTKNSYFHSTKRLVTAVGVKDLAVVDAGDVVMVAPLGRVQEVKKLVETLRQQGRPEVSVHSQVFRPWGSYETVCVGDRFQVKIIIVKPGQTLSLQMHHHRAEHWIVVKGTARITNGDEVMLLSDNQSTYIPLGTKHRLENPGVIPLEMIEVQSGSYLGEDDIVRFEDNYGRIEK